MADAIRVRFRFYNVFADSDATFYQEFNVIPGDDPSYPCFKLPRAQKQLKIQLDLPLDDHELL